MKTEGRGVGRRSRDDEGREEAESAWPRQRKGHGALGTGRCDTTDISQRSVRRKKTHEFLEVVKLGGRWWLEGG